MTDSSAAHIVADPDGWHVLPDETYPNRKVPAFYVDGSKTALLDEQDGSTWDNSVFTRMVAGSSEMQFPDIYDRRVVLVLPDRAIDSLDTPSLGTILDQIATDNGCGILLNLRVVETWQGGTHLSSQTRCYNVNDDPAQPRVRINLITKENFEGSTASGWAWLYNHTLEMFVREHRYSPDAAATLQQDAFHKEINAGWNTLIVISRGEDGQLVETPHRVYDVMDLSIF